jgi:LytS/YehU family sensor histidine kinase
MMFFWYDMEWKVEAIINSMPIIMTSYGVIGPLSYWLIVGAYYLKKYYEQYRERQLRSIEMQGELASIRLHVLKVQLHPHFLFNTLHNINSLIYEAPETAKRVLTLLKRFLQISIERVNQQEVPLMDELEFTGTYLAIEKTRFSDRLTVKTDIEKDTLEALVPSFLLQPLIENAVKHGISKKMQPGLLKITSRKINGFLNLSVEDNGPGLNGNFNTSGIGLENIRQRLSQLYSDSSFELLTSDLGGLKVNIKIPLSN